MLGIDFQNIFGVLGRLPEVIQSIPDVLRNPAASPVQAAVFLAIALGLSIIVLLSIMLVILRPPKEPGRPIEEDVDEEPAAAPEPRCIRISAIMATATST